VTHKKAKDQDQGSVGSKDRVETDGWIDGRTDGWTEAIALPPVLMWSVIIHATHAHLGSMS